MLVRLDKTTRTVVYYTLLSPVHGVPPPHKRGGVRQERRRLMQSGRRTSGQLSTSPQRTGCIPAAGFPEKEEHTLQKIRTYLAFGLALVLLFALTGCSQLQQTLEGTISDLGESVLNQANSGSVQEEGAAPEETAGAQTKTTILSSDAERFTEDQLREPVEELVKGAFEVCAVFYNGTSFKDEPITGADGNPTSWYPVDDERFTSVEDLKAFAEQYYTSAFASAALYSIAFEGDYPKYSMQDGVLCINNDVGGLGWGIEWKFDTMKIVSQTENGVVLEMDTLLFDEEDGVKQLTLARVDGEWRLDSSVRGV